jgi:hypothetical protein
MPTNEHQLLDIWRRGFFYELACRALCAPIPLSKNSVIKSKNNLTPRFARMPRIVSATLF